MTETRKLAAILAADVVGYSRLMGGDGEGGQRASRRQPVREVETRMIALPQLRPPLSRSATSA